MFRHVWWSLKPVEHLGVRVAVRCVSGTPVCGAEPSARPVPLTTDAAMVWMERHLKATGHRRYDRGVHDSVQWDPPADVDLRTIKGMTT